jgi:protein-S-isoprenylcysteine O-methyltransferase Ste14
MSKLDLKISPVLLTLLWAGLMAWIAARTPGVGLPPALRLAAGLVFLAASAAIGLAGVREFRRAKTTVNPFRPRNAGALVDSGIFARSRNPMYLALLMALIGWGLYLGNLFALASTILYVAYLNRFQIRPEEHTLEELFGSEFTAYRKRVRRWI